MTGWEGSSGLLTASRNSRMPCPRARASSGNRLGPRTRRATIPMKIRWTGFSMPITHQASARADRADALPEATGAGGRAALAEDPPALPLRSRSMAEESTEPAGRTYPPPPAAEPFWPAQATIVVAIGLQLALPARLTFGPLWLLPALEGVLFVGMSMATPRQLEHEHTVRRRVALSLTAFVSAANIFSLAALTHYLLHHGTPNPRQLIVAGVL